MAHKLVIFVSSTADLSAQRDAVEGTLNGLDVDGSRFETWPPSPNPEGSIAECLRHLEEADAVILLLGATYGTVVESGLSATHLEYRHALAKNKPLFPFLLHANHRDRNQEQFIAEVQGERFRGHVIRTIPDLKRSVRDALLQEYTRCFRTVHGGPPSASASLAPEVTTLPKQQLFLSDDPKAAFEYLSKLYQAGQDAAIQRLAPQIVLKFGNSPQIANIMYMAEVNLGMRGAEFDAARIEQAIAFWAEPLLQRFATDYSLAYCQGNAHGVLKRFREAIARYEFALAKEPRFPFCWKNLGTAYIDVNDRPAAKQCFLKAIEFEPDLFEAHYSLTSLAIEDENYREALEHLDRILLKLLMPIQQSWVQGLKAKSHAALGEYEEAIRSIEAAIAVDPDAEWPWYWSGHIHSVARRADKRWLPVARTFAERLVCRFPSSGEAWGELGYTYWQLRLSDLSEQLSKQCALAYSKAVDLGFVDNGLIHDRLGHLSMDAGRHREAETAFRSAVAADAASYGYCLGTCLVQLERYDEALEWLTAASEKHQPDALSWGQVAFCYDKLGDRRRAIEAYEKAVECDAGYALAWFNLGGMLWNDGRRIEAFKIWREALTRFPEHELAANVRELLDRDE